MSEQGSLEQNGGDNPALTVILVVGGQRERAANALRSLLSQSVLDRMEILLFDLGPEGCPPLPNSDHSRVQMTRLGPNDLLSNARVRGVHAARSPVVAFMEEHCEMQPGWADTVVAAHREPWAAVGTDFINANPGCGSSNTAFRMNYGVYVQPCTTRGPVNVVAGQNSAFKRDVLLRYEPNLELLLNADLVMQRKMIKDGYRMFYEPSAKMAHRNETTLRSLAVGAFYWNWCFSNIRAQMFNWGIIRRAVWLALLPLAPWRRAVRTGLQMWSRGYAPFFQFLRELPFFVAVGYCSAAGQAVGLLNRLDRGARGFSHFEMNEPRVSCTEVAA